MTEKTLRQLIEEAEHALDTYKHPDVSEAQERLDEILRAGELGGIIHDKLEALYERDDTLFIRTSYSVRCCEQRGEFEFPSSVIDAPDPIAAIKRWSATNVLEKAERHLSSVKRDLEKAEVSVAKARAALRELGFTS